MIRQNEQRYKSINNIIVAIIGFLILVCIFLNIVFPVFKINNDLKNNFSLRNINGREYLELEIKGGDSFHKISIAMDAEKNNKNNNAVLGKVYQDELGLYAMANVITSREQLIEILKIKESTNITNGELIQDGNLVYFISEDKYRAFANAETFDQLGFDWDKVQRNKEEFLNKISKGQIIDKTNSYLPDSFVEVSGKIYLLGVEKKHSINSKDLEKYIRANFSVIKVVAQKLQPLGNMQCGASLWGEKKCKFKDNFEKTLPRAVVFVETNGNLSPRWFSTISTFDKFKSATPRRALANIKRNLILRYDQRFGIGNRINK